MAHRIRSAPPFTSLRAECRKDAADQGGFGSVMTSPSAEMNAFSSCHRESIVAESNDTFLIFSKLRLGRILQKGSYLARGEWFVVTCFCGRLAYVPRYSCSLLLFTAGEFGLVFSWPWELWGQRWMNALMIAV